MRKRKSTRKTYQKKSTAQKAVARGQSVYKVKGGYRLTKRRATRRRRRSWP
ncbi:MAG: hypothetical protein JW993_10255 [Sedimentisphaerales bacterium]|nr:hypothetical protein [Sedimentisphaerales bacterium]